MGFANAHGRHRFEIVVRSPAEARSFHAAVFRYLDLHHDRDADETVAIHFLPEGAGERETVELWSRAAISDFAKFWRRYRHVQSPLE